MSRSDYARHYRSLMSRVRRGIATPDEMGQFSSLDSPYERSQRAAREERAALAIIAEASETARRERQAQEQAARLLACEREESHRLARETAALMESANRAAAGIRRAAIAAAFRESCSVEDLLRSERERSTCWRVLGCGQKYYESALATRAVVVEAMARLRQRHDRRSARGQAEKARRGEPGRIARLLAEQRARQAREREEQFRRRIVAGKLGGAAARKLLRDGQAKALGLGSTRAALSDGIVRALVRSVGRIGDQCEHDLAELHAYESFSGKRGRHHKLEGAEIASVQEGAGRALLITVCQFCSYGSSGMGGGDRSYGSVGGRSYRAYLVVRDTTTGEAHILRVPPKFGNPGTKFYGQFCTDRQRVAAAIAWTFSREPAEYRPTVEA